MEAIDAGAQMFLTASVPYSVCSRCFEGGCYVTISSSENQEHTACAVAATQRLMLEEEVLFLKHSRIFISTFISPFVRYADSEAGLAELAEHAEVAQLTQLVQSSLLMCGVLLLVGSLGCSWLAGSKPRREARDLELGDVVNSIATRTRPKQPFRSFKPSAKKSKPASRPVRRSDSQRPEALRQATAQKSAPQPRSQPLAHPRAGAFDTFDTCGAWDVVRKRRRWYSEC